MDLIDEISAELRAVKTAHPRSLYQVTCSDDVVPQLKAAAVARAPWLDGKGLTLSRVPVIGTPLVIDPRMPANTYRVDWSAR
jgi:hypothetical protein